MPLPRPPEYVTDAESEFLPTLLKSLGINKEIVGDCTLRMATDGFYHLTAYIIITREAWSAACKAESDRLARAKKE